MTAQKATFELQVGPLTRRELVVASFRGREEISRPFRFDVVAVSRADGPPDQVSGPSLLGQPAALTLHVGEGPPRVVRGVVSRIERTGKDTRPGEAGVRLRIVPRLWLLGRRKRSRIFQDCGVTEIVDAVLDEYRIGSRWRLSRPAQPRAYVVQHQETDLAFVTRLLAEDGIFFCFVDPAVASLEEDPGAPLDPTAETLLLSDAATYPSLDLTLLHRGVEGLVPTAEHTSELILRRTVQPSTAVVRDFDFMSPALLPTERATATPVEVVDGLAPDQLEHYEHHGDYERPEVSGARAKAVLEQLRRRAAVARGVSFTPRLSPGYQLVVAEHPLDDLDGAYALTRVVHEGTSPDRVGDGRRVYENRFECVPAQVPYRPRRPARELKQVTETAVVVGPPGQEIHTDEHGRVKVEFHWDREATGNDTRSCWIRVAQAWAGPGWGFQFIPRVGMEVLVTFLGGDPDRPVITGCLYNAHNPPSHPLPRSATRSGIRTRTVPGATSHGSNELSFEDRLGEEQVYLHAERDLEEVVEHDHKIVVGRRDPVSPVGCQSIEVGDRQTLTVGESQVVLIGGDHEETVLGGRTERVAGGVTLRVEGTHEQWDDASFAHHVADEHRLTVGGALETNVAAGARITVGGDHRATVGGDHHLSARGSFTLTTGDVGMVNAGLGLTLSSTTSIRLVSGKSVIEIGPEEITLSSPTITLLGGKMVSTHVEGAEILVEKDKAGVVARTVKLSSAAAVVSLTSDGLVGASSKSVALHGKGANVILDDSAEVNGSKVKLGSGSAVDGEYDKPQPVEQSYLDVSLTRPVPKQGDFTQVEQEGVAGARFVVEASDGRLFQGVLDAEGKARVPIPKGQAKVSFPDYDAGGIKAK